MEKRTILAILISMAIWAIWLLIFPPVKEGPENQKTIPAVATEQNEKATPPPATAQVSSPAGSKPVFHTVAGRTLKESTFEIETGHYLFTFSSRGAVMKNVTLKDRNMSLHVENNPYHAKGLLDFSLHFNENHFREGNDLDRSVWSIKSSGPDRAVFTTQITIDSLPVTVEKSYIFTDDAYGFNIEYRIINRHGKDLSFGDGTLLFSPGDLLGPELNYDNTYNLPAGIYSKGDDFEKLSKGSGWFSKAGDVKTDPGSIDWVGIMSRYYLVIMIPQDFKGSGIAMDNRSVTGYRTGIYVPVGSLKARSEIKKAFRVYLGEKDKDKLKSIDETIVKAADISTLIEPIRYFVLWCLKWINKVVGNLGWALVIFSILTKFAFQPLTNKSTESMKKMQLITPKINELRAKYKDKPDVLQKETLKLYQENKVNPLGGCLPILVQMPFFFALYSALINSIDLWNAPFILWIKDLSMPDTVATISGFNVNILPIIMTLSTYLQQKMSTVDTGSQQQKIMMSLMPLMFIFIFWSMPSGLVLYWTLQNVFQIANQLIVNWRGKKTAEA